MHSYLKKIEKNNRKIIPSKAEVKKWELNENWKLMATWLFPTFWILKFRVFFSPTLFLSNKLIYILERHRNKTEIIRRHFPQPPIPKVSNLYGPSFYLSSWFPIRKNHLPLKLQKVHFSVWALHSLLPTLSEEINWFPLCVFNLSLSMSIFFPWAFTNAYIFVF